MFGLPQKLELHLDRVSTTCGSGWLCLSFTPGFSPVERHLNFSETVLTVSTAKQEKPLETVLYQCLLSITGLKPGVNEMTPVQVHFSS